MQLVETLVTFEWLVTGGKGILTRYLGTESALERIGEVAATCTAVIFVCPQGFSFPWLLWLIAAFALMILYEIAWMRYFNGGGELADMYRPLGPIPIPLASLPVAAIFLLGVWYQSPLTLIAAIVLGIGHIGIHLGHVRELSGR